MNPIEKVLDIAIAEIGYLEKKNNSNLDSKTDNAGSANYTKYWRDVYPQFQGQPWCAAFVTWCFTKAFGEETATKLLRHYPYTYVPTIANLFTNYANPQKGDIVIFKRNNEFVHTGIVTFVSGDYFETIEGNTSGGQEIIDNGGAVCLKSYYNSHLPGTKFCRPDYSIVKETSQTKIYNYVCEMPEYAQPAITKLYQLGFVRGDGDKLNLSEDMLRTLVILVRILEAKNLI